MSLDGVPGAFRLPNEDWDGGPVDVTVADVADDERATIMEVTITTERGEASFEMSVAEAGEFIADIARIIAKHGINHAQGANS